METERDWLLVGIAAAAGLCLTLYLVASLASLVFGAGWPHIPPASLPYALLAWVAHPLRPASGFPEPGRRMLPGPVAIYATLAFLTAPLAFAYFNFKLGRGPFGATLRCLVEPLQFASGRGDAGLSRGARWATARDLRALIVSGPEKGRLILGRLGPRLIAAEHGHSLLVVGPTRTYKTTGLAIPALLDWQGPALATSIRRDLLDETLRARERMGQVWVYDPTGAAGTESCLWNPLEHCRTWQGAWRIAGSLVGSARSAPGRSEEARFWQRAAEKLLAPLLFAAATNDLTMLDVVHWINTREQEEVERCLDAADSPLASDAWQAAVMRDERTISSVITTLETALSAYEDADVLASTVGTGLSGTRLLEDPGATAYICAPPHEQDRLSPLFTALVREVIHAAYDRQARTGKPLDPPLLILLDEAGNVAPIPDLGKLAATAAGVGVQLVSVWHDLAQLDAFYGAQAETVLNNHRAKLVLGGVGDQTTLRWVQGALGHERVKEVSHTRGGRSTRTEASAFVPLAPADLVRQQAAGEGLLIYGNRPPARIKLRPYYDDRRLRGLARNGVAEPARRSLLSPGSRRRRRASN